METFEFNRKVEDGKIIITLPERFNEKEVKITIVADDEFGDEDKWAELPGEKKLDILKRYAGTAKYPDIDTSKIDVYDQ